MMIKSEKLVKAEDYKEFSRLIMSRMKRGVLTNCFMSGSEIKNEISCGKLFYAQFDGDLFIFRCRDSHVRLNYYIHDIDKMTDASGEAAKKTLDKSADEAADRALYKAADKASDIADIVFEAAACLAELCRFGTGNDEDAGNRENEENSVDVGNDGNTEKAGNRENKENSVDVGSLRSAENVMNAEEAGNDVSAEGAENAGGASGACPVVCEVVIKPGREDLTNRSSSENTESENTEGILMRSAGFSKVLGRMRMARGGDNNFRKNTSDLSEDLSGILKNENNGISKEDIRIANDEDFEKIKMLLYDNFDILTGCLPTDSELSNDIGAGNYIYAERDGAAAGIIHFEKSKKSSEIRHLAVSQGVRKCGLASRMFEFYISETRTAKNLVWVGEKNDIAIDFYKYCGYEPDGLTSEVYVRMPQDEL